MQLAALTQTIIIGVASMLLTGGGCFGSNGTNGIDAAAGAGDTAEADGATGADQRASDADRRYSLDALPTADITIDDQTFRVWVVREDDAEHPGAVQEGLMHVPPEEIADNQGMLFVFSDEALRGFWMLNTITPLDIAYARMNGTIVKIWQMPPQTIRTFSSIEPAMFALEVKQGTFERLGIAEGAQIIIPEDVFKTSP